MSLNAKEALEKTLNARKFNFSHYIRVAEKGISDAVTKGSFSCNIILSDMVNCEAVAEYFKGLGYKAITHYSASSETILEIAWYE